MPFFMASRLGKERRERERQEIQIKQQNNTKNNNRSRQSFVRMRKKNQKMKVRNIKRQSYWFSSVNDLRNENIESKRKRMRIICFRIFFSKRKRKKRSCGRKERIEILNFIISNSYENKNCIEIGCQKEEKFNFETDSKNFFQNFESAY